MGQIKRITFFDQEAALFLPGFLYSFNIADFKRPNCHLGYRVAGFVASVSTAAKEHTKLQIRPRHYYC
jgi:hypothetical protein